MIEIKIVISILCAHWLSDFVMQSDKMAKGKSSNNRWLLIHVSTYTLAMLYLCWIFIPSISLRDLYSWVILNGILHFLVDYVTSRWSSKLWKEERVHDFFVVIGLDQLIHYALLFLTYNTVVN